MTKILYLSYDGVMEPLGQSQILEYLYELSGEFEIFLVSYEKKSDLLFKDRRKKFEEIFRNKHISWIPLTYHRYPLVVSTSYDLFKGYFLSLFLSIRHQIKIVHARSYCAALIAFFLKKTRRTNFIFDMRGFLADERLDAGFWAKRSIVYKITKFFERLFILNADCVVSLTKAGIDEIRQFPYLKQKKIKYKIIPTCTNLAKFNYYPDRERNRQDNCFNLGYTGTVNGWYLFGPVLESFKILLESLSNAKLLIFNSGQHKYILDQIVENKIDQDRVIIKSVDFDSMPQEMKAIDAGIFFIKPCFSKKASSPTKLGEFLACGVPCLTNYGVGDVQDILEEANTGIVIRDFSAKSLEKGIEGLVRLSREKGIKERCRSSAEKFFSLKRGAESYGQIYRDLK